jgi:type IV pilus assembly protein PilY1
MFSRFNKLLSVLLFASGSVHAIDTDIYVNSEVNNLEPPNILLYFDNSANWNAQYEINGVKTDKRTIEHEAMYRFLDAVRAKLKDDPDSVDVNIGIMGATRSNSPGGGVVLKAFTRINSRNMSNITALQKTLYCNPDFYSGRFATYNQYQCDSILADGYDFDEAEIRLTDSQGYTGSEKLPSANRSKYATAMWEAYQYFSGGSPRAGTLDGTHDPDAITGTKYASPIKYKPSAETCGKNYFVMMANGSPDSGENTQAESGLIKQEASTSIIDIYPNNYESNWTDEWARYMANNDVSRANGTQTVNTFVIDVFDPPATYLADPNDTTGMSKPEASARALLRSTAVNGNGDYYVASNVDEVVEKLLAVLEAVQEVNDVFSAAALPVSVNVRGTNLNQVYIGVFRPDGSAKPRWFGNLKMYQLAIDFGTGTIYLADADGQSAANASTGFIEEDARSFWTFDSAYWSYKPTGEGQGSDNPDGEIVEKGAAAQVLRENFIRSGRKVYTCTACTSAEALQAFNTNNINITQAALGVTTTVERDALIKWAIGYDVQSEHPTSVVRPSIHGDVLHSRPAVVNYGDLDNSPTTDDDVYVFYGANDGTFHAIKGGTDESVSAGGGTEVWSFIPPEHYGKLKALYDNNVMNSQAEKPFFIDGVISSYVEDNGTKATRVIIYLTMRRGGKFIYAMDVTNPKEPKMLWRLSRGDVNFEELSQTWSAPTVAKMRINSADRQVLVFGMGYDDAKNDSQAAAIEAREGRGIMIVDAFTGEVIWQVGNTKTTSTSYLYEENMKYSVASDLTVIDRDRNGYADRIYFGDTGGQLWRVDMYDTDNTYNWRIHRLLKLTGGQKFLGAPDAAASTEENDLGEQYQIDEPPFDAVIISSGNREDPFDTSVQNYIIVYKDPYQEVVTGDYETITLDDLADGTVSSQLLSDEKFVNGWYLPLNSGEKGIGKPAIVNSVVFLNTFQPGATNTCSSTLGIARSYQFDYMSGEAVYDQNADSSIGDDDRAIVIEGGGLIPDPVPVIVDIDGKLSEAIISGTQVQQFTNTQLENRVQTFWSKDIDL